MKSNFIKLKCDFDTFYLSINQRFITTEPYKLISSITGKYIFIIENCNFHHD